MLLKLKTECGYQFTSKLESMFNDIKISRCGEREAAARALQGSWGFRAHAASSRQGPAGPGAAPRRWRVAVAAKVMGCRPQLTHHSLP